MSGRDARRCRVVVVCAMVALGSVAAAAERQAAPREVAREAKRATPVGGQFLGEGGWQARLPAVLRDGPPLLFMLSRAELTSSRWDWELPAVARAMAEELAAVLDEGCGSGCGAVARGVRARLGTFLDEPGDVDGAPRLRRWVTDEAGYHTWHRAIGVRFKSGALALDVECVCESAPLGMRMWNDVTTCDATLRERGRVVASYRPRVSVGSGKEGDAIALDAFSQAVRLPDGGELVIESGYEYARDRKQGRYEKAGVRGRVVVVGSFAR